MVPHTILVYSSTFYYFLTFSKSHLFCLVFGFSLICSHLIYLILLSNLSAFIYETSVLANQRCQSSVPLSCLQSHCSLTWNYFLTFHIFQCYVFWKTAHFLLSSQNLLLLEFLYLMETPLNGYQQDGSSSASFLGCPSTHKKLKLSLDGSGVWWRMDPCICMAESLHCSSETITTLLISYTPMQNVFGIKENKNHI